MQDTRGGGASSKFPKDFDAPRRERERERGRGINAGLIVSHCVVSPYVVGRRLMACKQAKVFVLMMAYSLESK